jgi:hypothetical protein
MDSWKVASALLIGIAVGAGGSLLMWPRYQVVNLQADTSSFEYVVLNTATGQTWVHRLAPAAGGLAISRLDMQTGTLTATAVSGPKPAATPVP